MKKLTILCAAAAFVASASAAQAQYVQLDLSPYVNLGFTNSWFINGGDFTPIIGSTTGNQGSSVPFTVANAPDTYGNGGNNNFWFGLYGGPTNQLGGPPGSFTIPVSTQNVTTVYTLTDNTFGAVGNTEFSVTFNGSGGPLTQNYVGADNTKDYNYNTGTTGASSTPNAQYWFVGASGEQWLQIQQWTLPANFGLTSITFDQIDGGNGAIVAGVTLVGAPGPTPGAGLQGLALLVLLGAMTRARALLQR